MINLVTCGSNENEPFLVEGTSNEPLLELKLEATFRASLGAIAT